MTLATLYQGDALTVLRTLPDGVARCCVTSPPYFGLRDYGVDGQIGLEPTPDAYVARLVEVFREVRRVLADDGTLWLNLGDSFANDGKKNTGLKPKDLIGIPWRVAFALQADGWYLRSDIIWHKPNPMPESVRDRPTKAHEYLFLLSKSPRYYYDADAVAEPLATDPKENYPARARITGRGTQGSANARGKDRDRSGGFPPRKQDGHGRRHAGFNARWDASDGPNRLTRNRRSVWTIPTKPYKGAHFATMPPALAEKCVLAGTAVGDTVLDPFGGSGTTASVAVTHRRNAIYIDLNETYIALAEKRIGSDQYLRGGR